MSKIEKDIERLKSRPKDFTYDELKKVLNYFGFYEDNKGRTSGSKVGFVNKDIGVRLDLHKPHPSNVLKTYQINSVLKDLKDWRLL